jgi:hypothetical protein
MLTTEPKVGWILALIVKQPNGKERLEAAVAGYNVGQGAG